MNSLSIPQMKREFARLDAANRSLERAWPFISSELHQLWAQANLVWLGPPERPQHRPPFYFDRSACKACGGMVLTIVMSRLPVWRVNNFCNACETKIRAAKPKHAEN